MSENSDKGREYSEYVRLKLHRLARPGKFQVITSHPGTSLIDINERSRGEYDTLSEAIEKAGTEWDYWKQLDPKEWLWVAVYDDQANCRYYLDNEKQAFTP